MTSNTKLMEDWNQLLTFKIKESDLAKPTETFLFNALINYLKMFGFDVAKMLTMNNSENLVERRNFQISFCCYIDHIYKVSKSSSSFVYYDLKHPTPKKTAHLLDYLLNYLFYYNMFTESIVNKANEQIKARDDILAKVHKAKIKKEIIEMQTKDIEKEIKDIRVTLPGAIEKLAAISEKDTNEKKEITELKVILNDCNSRLDLLMSQEKQLKNQIVSQEEANCLKTRNNELMSAIAEEEHKENSTNAILKDRATKIAMFQGIIDSIGKPKELFLPNFLEENKQTIEKHKDLMSQLDDTNQQIVHHFQIYKKLQTDYKALEEKIYFKENNLQEKKAEVETKQILLKAKEEEMKNLEHDYYISTTKVNVENEIANRILTSVALLVKSQKPTFKK